MVITTTLYAINFVATRYSVNNGFSSYDLVALRYLVAGTLLAPYFISDGLREIGWSKGLILTCLAGSPYMLIFISGLHFAPASHGAVLNPGVVPIVVFLCAVGLGEQRFSLVTLLFLLLIMVGLVLVTAASFSMRGNVWIGNLLLFSTGISWGIFTFLSNRWQLRPLQSAAVVSVISLIYFPFYLLYFYEGMESVSSLHLITQALFQGVVMSIGTILLFVYAVSILGAQTTSLFGPLVPLFTTILGVSYLAETPTPLQWTGVLIVILGMIGFVRLNAKSNHSSVG